MWFFGDNTNFNGGKVREQAPMGAFQAHVSYIFNWFRVIDAFRKDEGVALSVARHEALLSGRAGEGS